MTPQIDLLAGKNEMSATADRREERILLEDQLVAMQEVLNKVQKENYIMKMKSTITLGQMMLNIESIQEDNQFLLEKYNELKKKVDVSEKSLNLKNNELETLLSVMRDA